MVITGLLTIDIPDLFTIVYDCLQLPQTRLYGNMDGLTTIIYPVICNNATKIARLYLHIIYKIE